MRKYLAIILGAALLAGCGSDSSSSNNPNVPGDPSGPKAVIPSGPGSVLEFAVVPSSNSASVLSEFIDISSGALTSQSASAATDGGPIFVKTSSNQNFVYVANSQDNSISAFGVDAAMGQLTSLPGSPYATVAGPATLAINANGTFLYAAGSGALTVYAINADGSLTALANSTVALPLAASPATSVFTRSGAFLNIAAGNGTQAAILTFAVDSATGLTGASSNITNSGVAYTGLATNASGTLLESALDSGSSTGQVIPFQVNADGTLVEQTPSSLNSTPGEIVLSANGFTYVATSAGVTGYVKQSDGTLIALPSASFAGTGNTFLSIDSTQAYLYGSNVAANEVNGYSISSDGTIAPVSQTAVPSPGHIDFVAHTFIGI